MPARKCQQCGRLYYPKWYDKPGRWATRKYCSKLCTAKSHHIHTPDRLMSKAQWNGECLEWHGARNPKGYGYMADTITGEDMVHRIVYALAFGPVPEGRHVLHRCDNPSCFRLVHLYDGTNQDNVDDKMSKGRHFRQRNPKPFPER